MQLHSDLSVAAISRASETDWLPSPMKGVERKMLERNGEEVARATTIVRYAPGSYFSPHVHSGGEEFIVLDGIFSDEHGDYPAGMYVRNPVGSKHKPYSKNGCIIMVKLWQYPEEDQEHVRIDMKDGSLWDTAIDGTSHLALHETSHERVEGVGLPAGMTCQFEEQGGFELFLLTGEAEVDGDRYGPGDWLRFPQGASVKLTARTDVTLWQKAGHLLAPPPLPNQA